MSLRVQGANYAKATIPVKQEKPKHQIWEHFEEVPNTSISIHKNNDCICKYCLQAYNCGKTSDRPKQLKGKKVTLMSHFKNCPFKDMCTKKESIRESPDSVP